MAVTTTTSLSGPDKKAFRDYIDSKIVESLQPNLYFDQFGTVVNVPAGNLDYRVIISNPFSTAAVESLTEGVAPTGVAYSVNVKQVSPTGYGINVPVTDLVVLTAAIDVMDAALREVGKVMARKIDQVIQTVVLAGDNVIYSGNKTSRSDLTASDVITWGDIVKGGQMLRTNSAPEFPGGGYVAVLHPSVVYDLMSNPSSGIIEVQKYAAPELIFKGELGMVNGVRLVQSSNVMTFSSSVTVYPTVFLGHDAYRVSFWVAEREGRQYRFHSYVLPPETTLSVNNPLGQVGSVGAKTYMAVTRTQEERIIRLESAASLA